jgi:hypothetical protein
MSLYTFLHNLLIVLVQIANKMGLQTIKKLPFDDTRDCKRKELFLQQLVRFLAKFLTGVTVVLFNEKLLFVTVESKRIYGVS